VLGIILWIAAIIALVYAWVATMQGSILGQRASFWFGNAMVFAVLAAPLRLQRGTCGHEECGGGVCKK
jgi:hypothetical protein